MDQHIGNRNDSTQQTGKAPLKHFSELHTACYKGNVERVESLLKGNQEHSDKLLRCRTDPYQLSPLDIACFHDNLKVIKVILKHEISNNVLESTDAQKNTFVQIAAELGKDDIIGTVLGNPNYKDLTLFENSSGRNILHIAATYSDYRYRKIASKFIESWDVDKTIELLKKN